MERDKERKGQEGGVKKKGKINNLKMKQWWKEHSSH